MYKLIPILFVLLLLNSCGHPVSASLSSPSPDGKTTINVNAKKQAALDPFIVTLEVRSGNSVDGSLQFEIAASSIDSSNVKFDWKDPRNCMIYFTQSDGEKRIFSFYSTNNNVILQEFKKD